MLRDEKVIYFPYPVIAPWNGGINGEFDSDINAERSNDKVLVSGTLDLDNNYVQSLIDAGLATFWIEIDCKNTQYHKEFSLNDNSINLSIILAELEGRVNILPSVVMQSTVTNFQDESFEEDYHGLSFTLNKGDYIAVANPFEFTVDIDHFGQPKSIFGVHPDKEVPKDKIEYEVADDKIWIKVAPKVANKLTPLLEQSPQLSMVTQALVLVPALHEAFAAIARAVDGEDGQSLSEFRWFDSFEDKLIQVGINYQELKPEQYDNYARKVLNISFDDIVSNLSRFTSMEGDDHE